MNILEQIAAKAEKGDTGMSLHYGFLYSCIVGMESKNVFEFGHLMGMKENKFNYLVDKNQIVNVYIPYGPYKYMIPYLIRRLYENMDTFKYMIN